MAMVITTRMVVIIIQMVTGKDLVITVPATMDRDITDRVIMVTTALMDRDQTATTAQMATTALRRVDRTVITTATITRTTTIRKRITT